VNDTKKARFEIANFENFLHLGSIRFDRYQSQRPPEPDIIAWKGGRQFGIEITNFHRESEKRRESEEDRILEAALELYNRGNGPALLLHAMWTHHFIAHKKDREQIAEKIAALALRHHPAPDSWVTLDWHQFDHDLMTVVDHISMYGMPKASVGHWSAARGRFVPQWNVIQLQSQIDRKNDKTKQYRKPYFEVWLLIVSPFGTPSAWMEVGEEIRNARFVSSFDKVFLLSSFPLAVVELRSNRS